MKNIQGSVFDKSLKFVNGFWLLYCGLKIKKSHPIKINICYFSSWKTLLMRLCLFTFKLIVLVTHVNLKTTRRQPVALTYGPTWSLLAHSPQEFADEKSPEALHYSCLLGPKPKWILNCGLPFSPLLFWCPLDPIGKFQTLFPTPAIHFGQELKC